MRTGNFFCLLSLCRFLLLRYIWCHFNNIIVEGGKFSARLNSLLMLKSCLQDYFSPSKREILIFFFFRPSNNQRDFFRLLIFSLPSSSKFARLTFHRHLLCIYPATWKVTEKSRVGVHGKFISHRSSDVCDRLKEKLLALSLSNSSLWHYPGEISCSDVRKENRTKTVTVTDHVSYIV